MTPCYTNDYACLPVSVCCYHPLSRCQHRCDVLNHQYASYNHCRSDCSQNCFGQATCIQGIPGAHEDVRCLCPPGLDVNPDTLGDGVNYYPAIQ